MPNFVDLTGERFGALTVIKRVENNKHGYAMWKCRCDCGNETIVGRSELRAGHISSCGCLKGKIANSVTKRTFVSLLSAYKRNAKNTNREFLLTNEEFKELVLSDCYYCGKKPSQITKNYSNGVMIYNGIDRIDNLQGYVSGNVRACCTMCNYIKNKNSKVEFLSMVKTIYENMHLESYIKDKNNSALE